MLRGLIRYTVFLVLMSLSLFSCLKDKDGSYTETITNGGKWGLQIGNFPSDVYARLQELGIEKGFYDIALVRQPHLTDVAALRDRLSFYGSITIETQAGRVERTIIFYDMEKVTSIQAGGALPSEAAKWPEDVTDQMAIKKGDPVSGIYEKLHNAFLLPFYKDNFKVILPGKPLNKPFDPAMSELEEWAFDFSVDINSSTTGRSSVRLYFKNGRLYKIRHEYEEFRVG